MDRIRVRPPFHIVALTVNMLGIRIGAELVTFISETASPDNLKLHVGAGANCSGESPSNKYLALCLSSVERRV
jgi:hypothetical protein